MYKKTLTILAILLTVGIGAAAFITAQLDISPAQQDIDIAAVGTYTLTLTTNADAKGGTLTWQADDPALIANINGAPVTQTGSMIIPTSSTCSGTPLSCTQTFDLKASPQSGITTGLHSITVTAFNQVGVAKAMVSGGVNPVPEIPAGILTATGLIGLIGLVRYRKKNN